MTRRGAFTVIEITLAVSLFSVIAFVLMDTMTTENRNAAALMDDLTVNNEARAILSQVSRDLRSANEVVLEAPQVNPPANTVGIDERLGKITLRYVAPTVEPGSADLKRFQIQYRLVGKNQPAPPSLPQAVAKKYLFAGQGEKWVYPLLRETDTLDRGSSTPKMRDLTLIGWVRELAFYQAQPPGVETANLPMIAVRLVMSAFKTNGPTGPQVESYREEFSTEITARAIVPSVTGRL